MSDSEPLTRSPELMSADDTVLLLVDFQEKLVPLIGAAKRIAWNLRRLLDGANILGVRVLATEQYPQGLGGTVPELAERLGEIPDKQSFSCGGCPALVERLEQSGAKNVLVVGIEAHVCVQQTVFDLMMAGYHVFVAVDAVGSRGAIDYETALRRMESGGATITTTEAALFEWCQRSGTPEFKQISQLVREKPPTDGRAEP